MTTALLIALITLAFGIPLYLRYVDSKKDAPAVLPNIPKDLKWSAKAYDYVRQINAYRLANGLEVLTPRFELLHLAIKRTTYWKVNTILKKLHTWFFGHKLPYHGFGFKWIVELAYYGQRPMVGYKGSAKHNPILLDKNAKYIGLSWQNIEHDINSYCCVIVAS